MADQIKLSVKVEGVQNVRRSMSGLTAGLAATLHITAGTTAANQIRDQAAAGRQSDGSSMSPYRTSGRNRMAGRTPDLTDSGLMLSNVFYAISRRRVAIKTTGARDKIGAWIHDAEGNNPTGRRWFGVGPNSAKILDAALVVQAGKIIFGNRGSGYVVDGKPVKVSGKVARIENP